MIFTIYRNLVKKCITLHFILFKTSTCFIKSKIKFDFQLNFKYPLQSLLLIKYKQRRTDLASDLYYGINLCNLTYLFCFDKIFYFVLTKSINRQKNCHRSRDPITHMGCQIIVIRKYNYLNGITNTRLTY